VVDSYGRETSIGNTAEYGGQPFVRYRYNEKGDIRKAAQHTYSVYSTARVTTVRSTANQGLN
jgi:hypothetical protein